MNFLESLVPGFWMLPTCERLFVLASGWNAFDLGLTHLNQESFESP